MYDFLRGRGEGGRQGAEGKAILALISSKGKIDKPPPESRHREKTKKSSKQMASCMAFQRCKTKVINPRKGLKEPKNKFLALVPRLTRFSSLLLSTL